MIKASSVELHKLRRELGVLEGKKGKGTELVSLYIPYEKNLADVMSQMREEYSQAMNIKSARTRKNVQSALEVIMQRLKMIKEVPENGIVLLVGTIPRGIKDKIEVYMITPPAPVVTYVYHCDSQFLLGTIKEMLTEKGAYGLLVLDRGEATVGLLKGKKVEVVRRIASTVPGKHGRGGQSQHRYERLIEIAAHEYMKRIAGHAAEVFLNTPDLRGIIIGGPGPTKEFFVNEGYLHTNLQSKVLGVVDVSYTDEFGLRELMENASEIFKDLDVTKEKALVQKFLGEVVKDHGLAAYGEKEVRHYLQMGAVETVLISEEVESFLGSISCSNCGHKEKRTIQSIKAFEKELQGIECPQCKEKSLGLDEYKSTLDELTDKVEATGANIEVISTETEEGQQLKAFGGIGAILRFRP
ncbi:MAG: peptide chain release factor 1 [Euryarchaeota archaeon]|nr:peptide chain release factor 1 [Euryarchaeota archaeon]